MHFIVCISASKQCTDSPASGKISHRGFLAVGPLREEQIFNSFVKCKREVVFVETHFTFTFDETVENLLLAQSTYREKPFLGEFAALPQVAG